MNSLLRCDTRLEKRILTCVVDKQSLRPSGGSAFRILHNVYFIPTRSRNLKQLDVFRPDNGDERILSILRDNQFTA